MGGMLSRRSGRRPRDSATCDCYDSDCKLEWMDDPVGRCRGIAADWLLDLEQQYAPDVVHLNSYGARRAGALESAGGADGALLRALVVAGGEGEEAAPVVGRVIATTVARAVLQCSGCGDGALAIHAGRASERDYGPAARARMSFPTGAIAASSTHREGALRLYRRQVWDEAKNMAARLRDAADPERHGPSMWPARARSRRQPTRCARGTVTAC